MAAYFRRKPMVYEAVQFNGKNVEEVQAFVGSDKVRYVGALHKLNVYAMGVCVNVQIGDYIVKDFAGEVTFCHADSFKSKYERLDV